MFKTLKDKFEIRNLPKNSTPNYELKVGFSSLRNKLEIPKRKKDESVVNWPSVKFFVLHLLYIIVY